MTDRKICYQMKPCQIYMTDELEIAARFLESTRFMRPAPVSGT